MNCLALLITSQLKHGWGSILFDKISVCTIAFIYKIFIAVIKKIVIVFNNLCKRYPLCKSFFFHYHNLTVIEVRNVITNTCKTITMLYLSQRLILFSSHICESQQNKIKFYSSQNKRLKEKKTRKLLSTFPPITG